MAFFYIPVPAGFILPTLLMPNASFIRWHAEVWLQPDGGGSKVIHLLPPAAGKLNFPFQSTSPEGTIQILCRVQYRLVGLRDMGTIQVPEVKEEGEFQFGCTWTYEFSDGQLSFEGYDTFAAPKPSSSQILQGSCENIQQKDQDRGKTPFVSAVLQLNLQSIPGQYSGWTLQLPVVGGPAYTLQNGPATLSDNWKLGGGRFLISIDVPKPASTVTIPRQLDPALPLQVMLTFAHEKDTDFVKTQLDKLFAWIDQIKDSNLLPAIQNRYLRLYIQSHASKTGDATTDRIYSEKRAARLRWHLDQNFGAIDVMSDPRGHKNARPLTGIKPKDYNTALRDDRNATVFIEEAEAKAALARDQRVMAQP